MYANDFLGTLFLTVQKLEEEQSNPLSCSRSVVCTQDKDNLELKGAKTLDKSTLSGVS